MNPNNLPGHGIDAERSARPGVPLYQEPPSPKPGAQYPPPRQESEVKQFMHGRPGKDYPPVWGTAQPPRGVAGVVRAVAYKYPDHVARHWLLLMAADRVDVWEHRIRRVLPFVALSAGAILIGRMFAISRSPRALES